MLILSIAVNWLLCLFTNSAPNSMLFCGSQQWNPGSLRHAEISSQQMAPFPQSGAVAERPCPVGAVEVKLPAFGVSEYPVCISIKLTLLYHPLESFNKVTKIGTRTLFLVLRII